VRNREEFDLTVGGEFEFLPSQIPTPPVLDGMEWGLTLIAA